MRWRIGRTRIRHVGGSPAAWWGMSAREAPPPIHLVHAQGWIFRAMRCVGWYWEVSPHLCTPPLLTCVGDPKP